MKTKIEKEVLFLKRYAAFVTIIVCMMFFSSYNTQNNNKKFEEIDVERINIVEKNGDLKMVISNQARQHPAIVNGKIIKRKSQRPPGIIFFNQIGDEMGGLIYGENGDNGHFGSLTWDKFKGDQTIGFRHLEGDNGKYSSGLHFWQQPDLTGDIIAERIDSIYNIKDSAIRKAAFQQMSDDKLLAISRLFIGKSRSDASLLTMNDMDGKERIIMKVDANGNPKLEFLDEKGGVILSIPD